MTKAQFISAFSSTGKAQFISDFLSTGGDTGPWKRTITITETGIHTLSTDLDGATVSIVAGTAVIDGVASATYENPDTFNVTTIGTVILTTDTANPKAQITSGVFKMPYALNSSTTDSLVVPENYSDNTVGYSYPITTAWPGTGDEDAWNLCKVNLTSALYGTDGTDAQGQLQIHWQPRFSAGDLDDGIQNLITANDESATICYYDDADETIKASDGTNTAEVACSPISGDSYNILIDYDPIAGLWVSVDGTAGSVVPFEGSFPITDDLKISYEALAPQYVELLSIKKESFDAS